MICAAGREQAVVSARLYQSEGHGDAAWLILAPGAGAGHDHPFMVGFARGLAQRGLEVVTFNFPYIERGRRVPDRNDTLESCWRSVLAAVADMAGSDVPLFAGGKSMGGRIASQVAADAEAGSRVAGLVFLGYPLHPPGRPELERSAHWPAIRIPALFLQGERDAFGAPDELHEAVRRFGGTVTVTMIPGGDHSFRVPARAGRKQADVFAEMQDTIAGWINRRGRTPA